MKKEYAAFFDLDHTILAKSSGRLFAGYAYTSGLIETGDLLKGLLLGLIHRIGFINTERVIKKWVKKYSGKSEEETINFSNIWFFDVVVYYFRESIIEEMEHHRSRNAGLVILSAATPYVCLPVKDYLRMDDVICTELEVENGLFTGRLKGEYCQGKEKLNRALEYCSKNGYDIEDSAYYGDSISDRFVLEKVGNPVCVSPDWKLKRLARKEGWKIIEE